MPNNFDLHGNVSFGIPEYIDIPGVKYDVDIGIIGLEVCITLERPGFRVKRRKQKNAKVGVKHTITQKEAIDFMQKKFKIKVEEEE